MKKIIVEDNVLCKIVGTTPNEDSIIFEELSYGSNVKVPKIGKNGKPIFGKGRRPIFQIVEGKKSYYNRKTKRFLTGFLPRVRKLFDFKIEDLRGLEKKCIGDSNLDGFEERDYQTEVVEACLKDERGCITASVGAGKTASFLRVIKALKDNYRILVLCHDKDIQTKNYNEACRFFDCYWIKSGKDKKWIDKNIVFSMIQTFKTSVSLDYYNHFDVIIVDEIHRVSETYKQVFLNLNARFRLGFTGTFPKNKERALLLEGLFGRKIKTIENKKIEDMGKILPIKIELYSPKNIEFKSLTNRSVNYQKIYEECIVFNKSRNRIIKRVAKTKAKKGLSSAIFTTRIAHAEELSKLFNGKVPVLTGDTKIEERDLIRKKLEKKEILIVIVNIWKEGVDIPSLNCAINAFGGKAYEKAIQVPGRAIRPDGVKEYGILVDFLDPWRYLNTHSNQRMRYYNERGWI